MPLNEWETLPRQSLVSSVDPTSKFLLKTAREGGRVKIRYTVRGQSSERWIKPKSLFTVRSPRWPGEYVEAYCELRNANRIFEISNIALLEPRLQSVETTKKRLVAPPGRIVCSINYVDLDGDHGDIEGIQAECPRCGHLTESFGTGPASIKRCLALLREECPNNETNFYVEE